MAFGKGGYHWFYALCAHIDEGATNCVTVIEVHVHGDKRGWSEASLIADTKAEMPKVLKIIATDIKRHGVVVYKDVSSKRWRWADEKN